MQRLRVRTKAREHSYEVSVGRGILDHIGQELRRYQPWHISRVAVVSNSRVFDLYGGRILNTLQAADVQVSQWLIGEGERFKSLRTAQQAVAFLSSQGFERNDAVLALGGGVVGDVAGFVASIYMRGLVLVHVPTTVLAQIDSSVGGKTGVNLPTGKNMIGTFHQPAAVFIDTETASTLPRRELVAGFCEMVKQGAIANRALFKKTTSFLARFGSDAATNLISSEFEGLIASHCAFKASIVAGDEREGVERRDSKSRRVLNFGHTVGHALESLTQYRRFRHGEAVGHGMLVAGEISRNLGLLDGGGLEALRVAVHSCGPLPDASDLDTAAIIETISRDKKSVGGRMQWVLLERIGRPRLVDGGEISPKVLRKSLVDGLRKRTI